MNLVGTPIADTALLLVFARVHHQQVHTSFREEELVSGVPRSVAFSFHSPTSPGLHWVLLHKGTKSFIGFAISESCGYGYRIENDVAKKVAARLGGTAESRSDFMFCIENTSVSRIRIRT